MFFKHLFLGLLILHFFRLTSCHCPVCTNYDNFGDLFQYNTGSSSTFLGFRDFGLLRCVQQCLFRTRCQSINFDNITNICELNQESNGSLQFRNGSIYSEIQNWPKRLALECENRRCENGTVCTIDGKTTNCSTETSPLDVGYTKASTFPFFYKIHEALTTFEKARNTCIEEGGQLVEIQTAEKNKYIKEVIKDVDTRIVSFGATDCLKEGEWRWNSSDTEVVFTDWYTGQPNNKNGEENCAGFKKSFDWKWNDFRCYRNFSSICEIPF